MAGKFLDPLELEYIDGSKWKITAPFDYRLGTPDGKEAVHIPVGFLTDFASVPKALWNLLPPTGTYGKAAVVHDWLYQRREIDTIFDRPRLCNRAEADRTLLEGMEVLGVGRFTRWTIYAGVRVGGWKTWNGYRSKE